MARLTYEVTQADIDTGISQDCDDCPHALAISRHVSPDVTVVVYGDQVTFCVFFEEHAVATTRKQKAFIADFDDGKPVKPGTFSMTGVPGWVLA